MGPASGKPEVPFLHASMGWREIGVFPSQELPVATAAKESILYVDPFLLAYRHSPLCEGDRHN